MSKYGANNFKLSVSMQKNVLLSKKLYPRKKFKNDEGKIGSYNHF